ncbi:hypothetical protein ULMS_04900 [Patiriisocius marinistellae]|uniref:Carboxypeptidase regulatory-like domain-containing protein n=1 Tax=Patiriisocius marinistellae TaxID=2494560 RepID=A0A5J4FV98_9FLAO|nr:hypothetical protein [Patiriisocius marinistellae]GEQ84982.1 hypothetical protein ULMS_04900 [Patiriisocius marinistellae]
MKKLLFICLTLVAVSCNNDDEAGNININCTEVFVNGLSVTIKDGQTDAILTDGITVMAVDGDYSETLMLINDVFVGAGERAGTYSITATGDNYMPQTINDVIVGEDECHVIPEEVTLVLSPN